MSCGKINFKNKKILLVGNSDMAYKSACEFISDGAIVSCLAISFEDKFRVLDVQLIEKKYNKEELDGYFLVYALSYDKNINHQIVLDANVKDIISANYYNDEDAIYKAMKFEEYDNLTVALSTSGKYPAFTKTVFSDIRDVYQKRYNERLTYLGVIRDYIIKHEIERKYLLEDLLSASIEELKFYCDSIQYNKATVLVFHGVKKNEMYSEILKFMKQLTIVNQGVYFSYLDDEALKEYNYFEELNRIISLEKIKETLELLNIKIIRYQPMLFENGMYYKKIESIVKSNEINDLIFDRHVLEGILLNYLPTGQNLLVLPDLKSKDLIEKIEDLQIPHLSVMHITDEIPELDKSIPLYLTGFFVLAGEDLLKQVFGKQGIYMHLIETDYDAEMNKKILLNNDEFIHFVSEKINM